MSTINNKYIVFSAALAIAGINIAVYYKRPDKIKKTINDHSLLPETIPDVDNTPDNIITSDNDDMTKFIADYVNNIINNVIDNLSDTESDTESEVIVEDDGIIISDKDKPKKNKNIFGWPWSS